ncbi:MAG: flagellar protein [Bacteroides sp.]|nr:flagellar protein [Bacteroides sp.]MCM1549052.1 flagellar protein [Clostridium sp.]
MEVRNCKNCGRMFNYIGTPICPSCEKELENKFQEVRQYVREHKEASITEVAEANEISVNQIKRWVRQERLAFSDASQVGLACENCGTMIRTGRFCDSCKNKMASELSSTVKKVVKTEPPKQKESAKMRFLDGR